MEARNGPFAGCISATVNCNADLCARAFRDGDQTSLDSQLNHEHPIFSKPELVPEEIRGFLSKAPKTDPVVLELFGKNNPVVPGPMSPK